MHPYLAVGEIHLESTKYKARRRNRSRSRFLRYFLLMVKTCGLLIVCHYILFSILHSSSSLQFGIFRMNRMVHKHFSRFFNKFMKLLYDFSISLFIDIPSCYWFKTMKIKLSRSKLVKHQRVGSQKTVSNLPLIIDTNMF